MNEMKRMAKQREDLLFKIIREKEKELKEVPDGTLWTCKYGKGYQYYQHIQGDETDKKYLSHKEEDLIKALAQKEYNQKALECAKKEYQVIKRLNKLYENATMEDIYSKIAVGKRKYINPIWLPDDLYIEKWNSYKYVGLEFREGTSEYYSDKGEQMRSKSEVLIANTLKKKGIPYRYECPLKLKQGEVFYPDFTILNIKERKEIYWEHFGLMDEHDYRERSFSKITKYEANGMFMGDKLIFTFETARQPLGTTAIERLIDKYLC